ncbi:uncharacterized protein MONOS_15698 [Monocercomonoides exilis]|uniref:uncharacterized protein n=1 Tax=Monocercomonoides exilis TaxID=2049356 RepID=UPI003559F948|nr:hypothetical protein MONOS_15698 [Monocercomonoides exilis]|eukprot:MONOS_15698.1-p1 / transcript=MONOS_15698.1 / gene=MONOS_15698 / organism=Monocercomonoides_exilis_PA203 / gene_product=unspecified product / transcript_product=unspecified product / location=Mono_scaffold01316:5041-5340(-) / protein_length=100 / sequence_SO=supercontig / SO=protein_coding / is_pseudo=false
MRDRSLRPAFAKSPFSRALFSCPFPTKFNLSIAFSLVTPPFSPYTRFSILFLSSQLSSETNAQCSICTATVSSARYAVRSTIPAMRCPAGWNSTSHFPS